MHEFSELVLTRIALLVDQSRSVLPLRSVKAEFGQLWGEKCTRARWILLFKLTRTVLFGQPDQNRQMESDLILHKENIQRRLAGQ